MTGNGISLSEVVDGLHADGLLSDRAAEQAVEIIQNLHDVQPLYIRMMVGFGAWLASLLLIGFVVGFSLAAQGGYVFVGIGLIVAAVVLRRRNDSDFVVQSSLAISLAGQGVLAYGVADFDLGSKMQGVMLTVALTSSILFVVFPDRIHRVLMVLFAASSITLLIYTEELNVVVPFLGPLAMAAFLMLHKHQARVIARGLGALLRPLMSGLMLSAFGCLLLSTVYILPELGVDFAFYPRPWISSLLLGALLIYVVLDSWRQVLRELPAYATPVLCTLLVVVIAAAWAVPGLLLALIVVVAGAAEGNRTYIGAGVAFLAFFLGAYFYGIQVSMPVKSATLAATGVAIMLLRWTLLGLLSKTREAVHD